MKKINETLRRLAGNEGFQKRYEMMRSQTLNHPEVKAFIQTHRDELTSEMVEKSLSKLFEYTQQSKECNKCPSLEGCVNLMHG